MANTGEPIGVNYPTLMPDLTDIADIQQAFQMYHIGIADWNGIDPPAANSIEGHYGAISASVADVAARPIGGGEVNASEPVVVGPSSLPVPDGYIWVDPDDVSPNYPQFPTVIYSPTDPSASLTVSDTGTIWVDEDGSAMVLNVNNYQPITRYQGPAPSVVATGQMWVDTDNNTLYIYNGTAWVPAAQPNTQYVSSSPSLPVTGQMWVDSDTGILYFYNGSSWQEVGGTGIDAFLLMGA